MREIFEICNEIKESYLQDEIPDKANVLYHNLGTRFEGNMIFGNETYNIDEIKKLFTVVKLVSKKEKNTSQYLENSILKSVMYFTLNHCDKIDEGSLNPPKLRKRLFSIGSDKSMQELHQISFEIRNLALELISITKNRDAFSGKRKGYGTEMLTYLSQVYSINKLEDLFISNLKTRGVGLLNKTLGCLQTYYSEDKKPTEQIIELLKSRATKAKKRSEIGSCLYTLVELDPSLEYEAMAMLDRWKDKHQSDFLPW